MEISEDKRLVESGIDPNGDPLDIMKQVRLRYEAWEAEERLREAEDEKDAADVPPHPAEKPLDG